MQIKSLTGLFLLIIIFINLVTGIIPYIEKYPKPDYWQRFPALKKKYYDSIYANKKGPFIRDEYVYSFAAGSLLKGVSPVLVNPETPPLGKYFISLSILLFKNEHMVSLIFGFFSLLMLFLVGKQIFSNWTIALIPLVILSFEPLFINQLVITPLLDIIQLAFLLSFFYFFNRAISSKKYVTHFVLSSIMVGGFISTKFFGTGVSLVGAGAIVLLLRKDIKKLIYFAISLILAPLLLLLNYLQLLFSNYNLMSFLGVQKWIFLYNTGHLTKLFTFFPLFLFNIWYSWWDNSVMSDSQWRITWPLSFITFLIALYFYWREKKLRNRSLDIVLVWTVLYILLLQSGYMSARYFVLLLPPIFLIMVYSLRILYQKINKKLK